MRPSVETRWGQTWNGVKDQKQPTYAHVRANLKRAQIQDERFAEIELENTVLLGKLSKILRRSRNPTVGTRDWTGGIRLTPNQVPVIDHWISADTTAFGAAVEPSSLNLSRRRAERERIEVENRALVARLQATRSTYDREKLDEDNAKRERWLASHSMPRPLSPILPGGRTSGSEQGSTSGGFAMSAGSLAGSGGAAARRSTGTLRPLRGGNSRAGAASGPSGKARAGKAPPPAVDPAVLNVLDLLSRHMRGASSSLGEMRVARDSLMEAVQPLEKDVTVELVDAGGVPTEVVTARRAVAERAEYGAAAGAQSASLLVVVHGGMFVTGSPRAGRHLAAKLSALMGVPVATPTLRLAPEHPYPAALDDLSTAYAWLSANAVGSLTAPPKQVGIFAESSGGALALSMLSRQGSAPLGSRRATVEPSAIVLASPWLDMTCSGQSYVANEARDPVMQRKRLLGIARAYIGEGETRASHPSVSPVLGNAPAFIGLPPTLVQVGLSEVLVDDSYELEQLAKAAGADVRVQLWDGVLHAWHTFYPLMPRALEALEQASAFLCESLGLAPPMKATGGGGGGGGLFGGGSVGAAAAQAEAEEEAERARAAVKLQAIARGRKARQEVTQKPALQKRASSQVGATTVKWTMSDDERHALEAAVRVQAAQRGKNGRRKATQMAAATYGGATIADKRAESKRQLEVEKAKIGYAEAHGRGGRKAMEHEDELLDRQAAAATKVQAITRGRAARKPQPAEWKEAGGYVGIAPAEREREEQAAVRMQAMQRAKNARTEAMRERDERAAAATKLAAARRGQLARAEVGEKIQTQKQEQQAAATLLQTRSRGAKARKEQEERQKAAVGLQRVHRGAQGRKEVARMRAEQ